MNGFRFGMALAAIALLPASPLLAQQPNPPAGQNQAPANATKPMSGPGAPGVTPSRRDEPGSSSSTKETPPIAGANSFTESQARERIAKAGYSSVKSLEMDAQGIWRGKAQKAGKDVGVALDYRGNVVQQ
jgi:hypothetical protein